MAKRLSVLVLLIMIMVTTNIIMKAMHHDLAYDKRNRIVSAWSQNYTTCYKLTYYFDSHRLDYTTAPVYTPGKPQELESPELKASKREIYYLHLLNRIRTYLMLNGFKNQSPALAYMHQLFYAKTEIPEHKEAH